MDLLLQCEEHEEFQKMKEEVIGGDPDGMKSRFPAGDKNMFNAILKENFDS